MAVVETSPVGVDPEKIGHISSDVIKISTMKPEDFEKFMLAGVNRIVRRLQGFFGESSSTVQDSEVSKIPGSIELRVANCVARKRGRGILELEPVIGNGSMDSRTGRPALVTRIKYVHGGDNLHVIEISRETHEKIGFFKIPRKSLIYPDPRR